jgi:hypothetical protein
LRPGGGPVRLDAAAVAENVPGADTAWLAAPFTALDGRLTGLSRCSGSAAIVRSRRWTRAVIVQLAQTATATFERMDLYRRFNSARRSRRAGRTRNRLFAVRH